MPATLRPGPAGPAAPAAAKKQRFHIPRPALPPNARLFALLWQGAALGAGFVLAGGRVLGAAPFGIAFLLGCAPGYALAGAVGAAAGSLLMLPAAVALPTLAALAAALAARLLRREAFAPAAVAACAMLLAGQGVAAWRLGSAPLLWAAVLTAILAVGAGLAIRTSPVHTARGACLWLGLLIVCSQRAAPFGLMPGVALLAAAGLAAVWGAGPSAGAAACLAWAAALACARPDLCGAALAAGTAALAAGVAVHGARRRCAGAFAAVFAVLALVLPHPQTLLPALLSGLAGAALFVLLPANWLTALLPAAEEPAPIQSTGANAAVAGRLSAVAQALADVGDTVNAVCAHGAPPRGENFDFVVDYTARRLCQGCRQRERCWIHSYSGMVDGLYHLKAPLEARGKVEIEDLQGMLSACAHPSDLCAAVGHGYRLWRSRRQTRARAAVLRAALRDQYTAVAEALAQLAGQMGAAGLPDPKREARAARLFAEIGLEALECSVSTDLYGRMTACVTVARAAFAPEELAALTQELGRACQRDLALPEVRARHTVTTLTFAERPQFCAVFGAANHPAAGQSVSGDACEQFCDGAGRARLLLCDGMGTGPAAAVDGRMAARLCAELLRAGFSAESTARLVNIALGLKNGEQESGATLDVWTVDLYTGRATGYKAGGAPSFLIRGGVPRALEDGGGLPMGILDTAVGRAAALTLNEGDILVAVSDGVLAAGSDRLLQQLAQCARLGQTPAELARAVADAAVQGGAKDDCTVLALQLLRA